MKFHCPEVCDPLTRNELNGIHLQGVGQLLGSCPLTLERQFERLYIVRERSAKSSEQHRSASKIT